MIHPRTAAHPQSPTRGAPRFRKYLCYFRFGNWGNSADSLAADAHIGETRLRRLRGAVDVPEIDHQRALEQRFHAVEIEGAGAPHRLYNLGNSHPESVLDLIGAIEAATGKSAQIEHSEGPPGDVKETYADISRAARFRICAKGRARRWDRAVRGVVRGLPGLSKVALTIDAARRPGKSLD
ncbi:MAG TPA: hypothetical protein VMD53_08860, partial [Rhizomicrobium sp.]|nr:hypothetical protein [Rhizomicrobium sp.]